MKLPQFVLRDLFWLVLVSAICTNWWLDHHRVEERLHELEYQFTSKESLLLEQFENKVRMLENREHRVDMLTELNEKRAELNDRDAKFLERIRDTDAKSTWQSPPNPDQTTGKAQSPGD